MSTGQILAMKSLKERMAEAQSCGFTIGQLAAAADKTSAAASQWASGETKSLKADSASGLAALTGWNAEWWATGKGPRGETIHVDESACQINQYDTGGAMGSGLILRDQPGVIKSWNVSQEWVQKNVRSFSAAKNLCIVTGFGDSMRPMFNPGDPLLVDLGVASVDFDSVYFFRVGDEGFVKRLQRVPGIGIRVLSANRDNYEPWTITHDMDFQVLGRVLKVWKSEDF